MCPPIHYGFTARNGIALQDNENPGMWGCHPDPHNRQLLALTNTSSNQNRQDKFREQAVAAGAAEPVLGDRPLVLDAMAMIIRDDLARSISRRQPRRHPRFWDKWIKSPGSAPL
jgi:hypothetical protein